MSGLNISNEVKKKNTFHIHIGVSFHFRIMVTGKQKQLSQLMGSCKWNGPSTLANDCVRIFVFKNAFYQTIGIAAPLKNVCVGLQITVFLTHTVCDITDGLSWAVLWLNQWHHSSPGGHCASFQRYEALVTAYMLTHCGDSNERTGTNLELSRPMLSYRTDGCPVGSDPLTPACWEMRFKS